MSLPERPTISFCITTRGPAERVHALLRLVRPHVDEIVLAVDRSGDLATLEACSDLADRRLTFELDGTASRLIGWILAQCRGEWILRLDDDEVPSAALLDRLGEIVREARTEQVLLPRLWLAGDPGQYLDSSPWKWELLPRLLRNSPGLWRFRGRMHDHGDLAGEAHAVLEPIYHLDLLLNDLADRRDKMARYEARRPGLILEGVPVNALYVPEDALAPPALRAVPAPDRTLIERVLDPGPMTPPAPASASAPAVEHATSEDIDRHLVSAPLSEDDHRSVLRLIDAPDAVRGGCTWRFLVAVTNAGGAAWPSGDDPDRHVRLGWRWRSETGELLLEGRQLLGETVAPGQEALVLIWADTPVTPGAHRFEVELVNEHVRWFGDAATTVVQVDALSGPGLDSDGERRRLAGDEQRRLEAHIAAMEQELAAVRSLRASPTFKAVAKVLRRIDGLRGATGPSQAE